MISQSDAGPAPVAGKYLKTEDLIDAFKFVHQRSAREAAKQLGQAFADDNGCEKAVEHFHAHLPLKKMCSALEPSFAASLYIKEYDLQISNPVAQVLLAAGAIEENQLSLHPTYRWNRLSDEDVSYLPFKNMIRHGKRRSTVSSRTRPKACDERAIRNRAQNVLPRASGKTSAILPSAVSRSTVMQRIRWRCCRNCTIVMLMTMSANDHG